MNGKVQDIFKKKTYHYFELAFRDESEEIKIKLGSLVSNFLINDIKSVCENIYKYTLPYSYITELAKLVNNQNISSAQAKLIILEMNKGHNTLSELPVIKCN